MIVNLHQYQDPEIFSFDIVNRDNRTIEAAFANITSGPTPEAARAAIGASSNPNLLDNAYFMGDGQAGNFPIDQNGDGIPDRWSIVDKNTEIEYSEVGLKITNNKETGGNIVCFRQNFNHIRNNLPVTVSVFVKDFSGTWFLAGPSIPNLKITDIGVTSITIEPNQGEYFSFYIFKNSTGASDYITIKVPKIEYGRTQTVGHKEGDSWVLDEHPPEYGAELLKCQRYYQLYSTAGARPSKAIDCRPVMRIDPTQGTTIIGGVTYYYNNASL